MQWLRVETKFQSHPKTIAAIALIGRSMRARVLGVWVEAALYAAEHDTDGFVPLAIVHTATLDPQHQKIVKSLLAAGLLEPHPNGQGYLLHDFTDYNPSKESQEAWRAQKSASGRIGGLQSGHARRTKQNEAGASSTGEAPASFMSKQHESGCLKQNEAPILSVSDPSPIRSEGAQSAPSSRARAFGAGSPSGLINGQSLRAHGSHAYCNTRGLCVPYALHDELLGKLGGPDPLPRLQAFYDREIAALGDRPVGDDPYDFWRHRFAAWVGTVTAKPPARLGRAGQTVAAVRDALLDELDKAGA